MSLRVSGSRVSSSKRYFGGHLRFPPKPCWEGYLERVSALGFRVSDVGSRALDFHHTGKPSALLSATFRIATFKP